MSSSEWQDRWERALRKKGVPVVESLKEGVSDVLSAANLWMRAIEKKRWLTKSGARARDVICESAGVQESLVTFAACALGGFVYWPVRDWSQVHGGEAPGPIAVHRLDGEKFSPIGSTGLSAHLQSALAADPDLVLVLCTSGTSGRPRPVALRSATLLRQIDWHREAMSVRADDARIVTLPHQHCFGLVLDLLVGLFADQTIFVRNDRAFHPRQILELARAENARQLACVPRQAALLLAAIENDPALKAQAARMVLHTGGAFLSDVFLKELRSSFDRVYDGYGMTEYAAGVLLDGDPVDGEVRLAPVHGSDLEELHVKSPHLGVFDGCESRIDRDGYYATGDLAKREGSSIRVLGRGSDVIKGANGLWLSLREFEERMQKRLDLSWVQVSEPTSDRTRVRIASNRMGGVSAQALSGASEMVRESLGRESVIEVVSWDELSHALTASRAKGVSEAGGGT